MKQYNRYLYTYLVVVFGLAWSIILGCAVFADWLTPIIGRLTLKHPIIIFVLYLPSLTGLGIYWLVGGIQGVRSIARKLLPRRQDCGWFLILLVIFIGFALCMRFGCLWLGIDTPAITDTPLQMVTKALWNVIEETGLLGGLFGWIGFLLPLFQKKFKCNIRSALLTGLLFGLWILPGYGLSSVAIATSYLLYVLQLMAFITFASYVFNATAGNLSCYLFAFWLAATGSHIQLYYFNIPVQVMEVIFLTVAAIVMHFYIKNKHIASHLQAFPEFVYER